MYGLAAIDKATMARAKAGSRKETPKNTIQREIDNKTKQGEIWDSDGRCSDTLRICETKRCSIPQPASAVPGQDILITPRPSLAQCVRPPLPAVRCVVLSSSFPRRKTRQIPFSTPNDERRFLHSPLCQCKKTPIQISESSSFPTPLSWIVRQRKDNQKEEGRKKRGAGKPKIRRSLKETPALMVGPIGPGH